MASIEAIYIIDINGKVVLDYPTSPSPPSIDTLISYVINPESGAVLSVSNETFRSSQFSSSHTPLESQNELQLPIIELSSSLLLFHQRYGNLIFLLPCSSTTPSFLPFEFISRLIETFESYLNPPLISPKIESNFDLVTLILAEMIDGGVPVCTEPDAIHGLVQPSGAISRLLSTASSSNSISANNVSEVPWRRPNVRHSTNELFVDIIETLTVVIPPTRKSSGSSVPSSSSAYYSGPTKFDGTKPLISRVHGAISITSRLSGVPEVSLILDTKNLPVLYPSFHPCVRFERFENFSLDKSHEAQQQQKQQKQMALYQLHNRTKINANAVSNSLQSCVSTFSFIPPDGKFLLASYELENVGTGLVNADLRTGLGPKRNEFEVRVWTSMSKDTRYIENLSLTISSDGERVSGVKTLRVTTGEFVSSDGSTAKWNFSEKTPLGWNATLRATLIKSTLDSEENDGKFGKDDNSWIARDAASDKNVANLLSFDSVAATGKSRDDSGRNTPSAKPDTNEIDSGNDEQTGGEIVKKEKKKKKSKKSKKTKEPKDEDSEANDTNGNDTSTSLKSSSLSASNNNNSGSSSRKSTPSNLFGNGRNSQNANANDNKFPTPVFPTHVTLSYKAIGQVPSGAKVKSLKISNTRGSNDAKSKPFKGVRYVTLTDDFVVR